MQIQSRKRPNTNYANGDDRMQFLTVEQVITGR